MNRLKLPNRRQALTFDVVHVEHERESVFTVSLGHFDVAGMPAGFGGGRPAEVFVQGGKAGTPVRHAVADAGILVSLLLQHGVDIATLNKSLSRDEFGRPGSVVASVVAAVASIDAAG